MQEIWTEKYRPQKLKEMVGQRDIVERLQSFVKIKNIPHCLFAGPPGCGKTTASLCIAYELYGNSWKSNFLELNASDERGIDTIRVKVKDFARTISLDGSFKIIYLDEADSLTRDAQHALRRTMEKYANTARFVLSCNYSSKIIQPIQSRTAVFRFSQLDEGNITKSLKDISKKEKMNVDDDGFKAIIYAAEGDMRRAINILQAASTIKGKISKETIYKVTSKADPQEVKKMLLKALDGNFAESRKQLLYLLYTRGLAGEDIIKEIHSQIFSLNVEDVKKLQLIEKIGEYEFRLTEGSNPRIQLEALLAQIGLVGNN